MDSSRKDGWPAPSWFAWLRRVAGVLVVVGLTGGPGHAQLIPSRLVWSPVGGSNVWNSSNENWVNQQTGVRQSWTPNAIAIFPGSGAYGVTLAEGVFVGGFEVADGLQVTVTGSTITLLGPPTLNALISGGSLRIDSGLDVFSQMTASGTLTLGGDARVSTINLSSAGSSQLRVAANGDVRPSLGGQTSLSGDAGSNTVAIDGSGELHASGSLGGGGDTLSVAGTLNTGAGVFNLGGGADTFIVLTGAQLSGTVNGGPGSDAIVAPSGANVALSGGAVTGFESVQVQSGAVLQASGNLVGDGDDVLSLAGTLNTGGDTFELGAGADTFQILSGAQLIGTVDGGAGADTLSVSGGPGLTLAGSQVSSFEALSLQSGAATLTGSHNYGNLSLGDGTQLNVSGGATGAAGGGTAALTGSAGANTVVVSAGATLRAGGDLGGGADVLDVGGALQTGAGGLSLGGGNDTFTLRSGAQLTGFVDGAAGTDTVDIDVAGALTLTGGGGGQVRSFENLVKSGAGALTLSGSHTYSVVTLGGGVLNTPGGLETSSLSVSGGAFGGGDDRITVGTVNTGAGGLSLGAGADVFRLRDGIAGVVDGGAGADRFEVESAGGVTLAGGSVTGFEELTKLGTGVLTLTGNQNYSSQVSVGAGTVAVGGVMETPTLSLGDGTQLNVSGAAGAAGGGTTTLTGGGGINTVTVNPGATLRAGGDLGGGADALDLGGALDTGAGGLSLGGGNDTFTLRSGAQLTGFIDGGAGTDTVSADVTGTATLAEGQLRNFENLSKSGAGALTLAGSHTYGGVTLGGGVLNASGNLATPTLSLGDGAQLNVAGGATGAAGGGMTALTGGAGANTVVVSAGATLRAGGDLGGGVDALDLAGALHTGAGGLSLGAGNDTFTLRSGAQLTGFVDGGAGTDAVHFDVTQALTLPGGQARNFESLVKSGAGALTLSGSHVYSGGVTLNGGVLNAPGGLDTPVFTASGGTFGDGDDFLTVGVLNTGSSGLSLGAGADVLRLSGGVTGAVDGGAGADRFEVESAAGVTVAGNVTGFEELVKLGSGTLTLTGSQSYGSRVSVGAGALAVGGVLETPALSLGDGTRLSLSGTGVAGAASGGITALTGGAGINTIEVNAGAGLRAGGDLGAGADALSLAGALDTGSGGLNLGEGGDTFTVRSGARLTGFVDGGAGADAVQVDIADALTLSEGQVRNFESLAKSGVGALTLTGRHGYGAGTTVSGGGLVVAGVLETPAVALGGGTRLELGGGLQAAGGGPAVVTGTAGPETIQGGAGSVLRATGTLGGGADVVTAGTLDTGAGALDLGAEADTFRFHEQVSGLVDGGAGVDALEADVAGAAALSGATVRGFELLRKLNGGTLTLVGDHGYSGGAAVTGGGLNVGGRLTAAVSVAPGARLGGAGVVAGGVAVAPGGTLAPGDSIGTLTVAGNLELFGTLEIEASPASADQVIVEGGVNIAGAGLSVLEQGLVGWPASAEFTIIDNRGAGPVNGTFGTVSHRLAFLDPAVSYGGGDGNDVVLTLTRNRVDLESVGESANQRAVLGALESMDPLEENPVLNAVLVLSAEEARSAADALSGEAHATVQGMMLGETRHMREAITGRIRQSLAETAESGGLARFLAGGPAAQLDAPLPGGTALWVEGIASRGEVKADGNAAAVDRSTSGVLFGVDVALAERWRVGMGGGYSRSSGVTEARGSESRVGGVHLASYAGMRAGAMGLRFGAAFGWHQIESVREAAFAGFRETLRAEYGGRTAQVFGEAGYTIQQGRVAVEPFGGLTVGFLETDAAAEQGGAAALAGPGGSQRVAWTTAGGRVAAELGGDGPVRWAPRGSVAWQQGYGDVTPERTLAWAGAEAFTVAGATVGRSLMRIEGGIEARSGAVSFGGGYAGQFGSGLRDHGFRFQVSFGL